MAKGYCLAEDVGAFLSRTFSAEELAQCNQMIAAVEAYVDGETGRGWLVGVQSAERHEVNSVDVYLKYAPVASVGVVTGRRGVGADEVTLTADVDYEVVDPEVGHLRLICPGRWDRLLVSYTPVNELPADLKQACVETVASWLQPTLQPGSFGLDSYSLPDLSVKFSRAHVQQVAPPLAQRVIERYRYVVAV